MHFPPPITALRFLLPATLALAALQPLYADDFPQWQDEQQANDIPYIPLESIRSFYKLTPLPADQGGSRATGMTHWVGNSGIRLGFRRNSCNASIGGYMCRLSHPVLEGGRGDLLVSKVDVVKFLDPVLRPTYISPRRIVRSVVIDPGHGGHDTGIVCNQLREADFTMLLARQLRDELVKRGMSVYFTREQNHALSDQQRVESVRRAESPVFVSLHVNDGRSDIRGIQTYSLQPVEQGALPRPGNETDEANAALAFCLHSSLLSATGAEDEGCRRARFSLLSSVSCPAALVEVGYATNVDEAAALNTEDYRSRLALALADGICTFAKMVNPDAAIPSATPAPDTTPPTPYKADTPAPPRNNSTSKGRTTPKTTPKNTGNAKPAQRGRTPRRR